VIPARTNKGSRAISLEYEEFENHEIARVPLFVPTGTTALVPTHALWNASVEIRPKGGTSKC